MCVFVCPLPTNILMYGLEPSGQRDYLKKLKVLRKCEERWENLVCFEEKKWVLVAFYSVCAIACSTHHTVLQVFLWYSNCTIGKGRVKRMIFFFYL